MKVSRTFEHLGEIIQNKQRVGHLHFPNDVCAEEADHIIALFNAAPELLEACEAVEWVSRVGGGGEFCPWCGGFYPDHETDCLRQRAIAKVKGD